MFEWMRLVVDYVSELTAEFVTIMSSVSELLAQIWDVPVPIHDWDHPANDDDDNDDYYDDHHEWSWSPSEYTEWQESEWQDWDDDERWRL